MRLDKVFVARENFREDDLGFEEYRNADSYVRKLDLDWKKMLSRFRWVRIY